jgi:hypothetical protein
MPAACGSRLSQRANVLLFSANRPSRRSSYLHDSVAVNSRWIGGAAGGDGADLYWTARSVLASGRWPVVEPTVLRARHRVSGGADATPARRTGARATGWVPARWARRSTEPDGSVGARGEQLYRVGQLGRRRGQLVHLFQLGR